MAIKYQIEKHASAYPTKVLASNGGKHIYNILLTTDTDNGNLVAKGDYADELDLYKEGAATTFTGKVIDVAANGNFYVEVTNPGDSLFVYNPPLIEEEYSEKFLAETNYYNAAGSIARAYELAVGDIVEVSKDGFEGIPTKGAAVTGVTTKKMTI